MIVSGKVDIPQSIRSDMRAGVPAPMATLFVELARSCGMINEVERIPSTFKKLLGFLKLDVFGEELANRRFLRLECAKSSIRPG